MSLFPRAVFVLLVAATFAAFFAAQRLKSAPQVAVIRKATLHFSPNGDGRRDVSRVRVRVRSDDDVTIAIVDSSGTEIERIATGVPARAKRSLRVAWDGTDAEGARAPEGVYRVRVSLRRGGRAATLGPRIRLDTTAPRPTVLAGGRDGRAWITGPTAGTVPFRVRVVSERYRTRMHVLRTDRGEPREVAAFTLPRGEREGTWDGLASGAPAAPGTYQIVAAVRDQAGNVGRSAPAAGEPGAVRGQPGVSVRALMAQPPADPVPAGESASFAVDSRGRPYRWRIWRVGERPPPWRAGKRRRGREQRSRNTGRKESGGELKVRAPREDSGVYVLGVRAGKDSTTVPFAVQAPKPAPILVVVPAITWFGRDTLDDDRDGLPNTLENGSSAAYPRLLADGLPAGFGDQVAPLLAFLDGEKIHYDITTDLTLAASRSGLAGERAGVLLAGPLRWISSELARRLRRYATDGGRVASFGAESMRRGVDVARDRLLRPLPPGDTDPFGTRLRPLRMLPGEPEPLQPIADEGATGLLTGVESLPGFSALEESAPSDDVQAALAAVDTAALDAAESGDAPLPETFPALALTQVGKGVVIRVGLPEWGVRLKAGSVPVAQLTRNVADILRGAEPQIRTF
ncbi:MAG: FlgD immunoglobulin-like domain containing protein [Solirubrobacteraceae bacterium]